METPSTGDRMNARVEHQDRAESTAEADTAAAVAANPQTVPVNAYRTTEALVVVAPLPGVMPDDIDVTVESGRLHIDAAMRTAAPKDYVMHEWHYGPFHRDVDIPDGFGAEASATFGNGQLAIRLLEGTPPRTTVTVPVHAVRGER